MILELRIALRKVVCVYSGGPPAAGHQEKPQPGKKGDLILSTKLPSSGWLNLQSASSFRIENPSITLNNNFGFIGFETYSSIPGAIHRSRLPFMVCSG